MIRTYTPEENAAFVRAIQAAPDDPAPRLTHADWLDECGRDVEASQERLKAKEIVLHAFAVSVGREYHKSTRRLYVSKFGDVLYGPGGQETADRERYSKKYHSSFGPARNLNGGARVDSIERPTCVILETARRVKVAIIPIPA